MSATATTYLDNLKQGQRFRFRYQIGAKDLYHVESKLISGFVEIRQVEPPNFNNTSEVFHPKTLVIPA